MNTTDSHWLAREYYTEYFSPEQAPGTFLHWDDLSDHLRDQLSEELRDIEDSMSLSVGKHGLVLRPDIYEAFQPSEDLLAECRAI